MTNKTTLITSKILQAYETKEPIDFIRHEYTLNEEEAYAVQDELIDHLTNINNTKIAGYKISMTSKETQAIANTHEPALGTLLTTTLKNSGDAIELDSLFAPLIEPEIMFIVTDDLAQDADLAEILAKTKICAGIEIPDARYKNWFPNFSLADLLADNTATGLVVLSDAMDPLAFDDFASIEMELFLDDEKIGEGVSSAVLDNPVISVQWLVKKLAQKSKKLTKGMVISSGTFISPLPAKKGTYKATYTGIGEVSITFI